MLSAIPCLSRIHSSFFSNWRRTVSSTFFHPQVPPTIFTEELVLPRHARCMLSRLCCNKHSLLLRSYFSRIGTIENPSCSACGHKTVSGHPLSILHCPATDSEPLAFWRLSVSLRSLVQALESCLASGCSWSFVMPPSLGRGRLTATTSHSKLVTTGLSSRVKFIYRFSEVKSFDAIAGCILNSLSFKRCCIWVERKYVFNLRRVENDLSASHAKLGSTMQVFKAEIKFGAMSAKA